MIRNTVFTRSTLALVLLTVGAACGDDSTDAPSNPATETYASSLGVNISNMTLKAPGLYVQDLIVGTGSEAIAGRVIRVTYSGWQINGQQFDSNVGGTAYQLTLGAGSVIKGWDQGIPGMRVGGKRKLVMSSSLAYGAGGSPPIGPNATLVFDVTLVSSQ